MFQTESKTFRATSENAPTETFTIGNPESFQ
jgi:hypothetical protein